VWFAAILAQPAPLMSWLMGATMHTHVAAAGPATAATTMPGMPDMSGTHGDAPTHHGIPADHGCMQLGACCCAPVLTRPLGVVPSIPGAPIRLARASIPSNVAVTPLQVPAYARPFAIGPPAAHV
jgi:hypothetical protein